MSILRLSLVSPLFAFALCACSANSEPDRRSEGAVARFVLPELDKASLTAQRTISAAMPGKIDPPAAVWRAVRDGAVYGEPDKEPLIALTCHEGTISVARHAPSDENSKALLAFVGYRGILRLKVTSDGETWRGALDANDPQWIAVTGGPFYATVAGGGKVISPASSIAAGVITGCKAKISPKAAASADRV